MKYVYPDQVYETDGHGRPVIRLVPNDEPRWAWSMNPIAGLTDSPMAALLGGMLLAFRHPEYAQAILQGSESTRFAELVEAFVATNPIRQYEEPSPPAPTR